MTRFDEIKLELATQPCCIVFGETLVDVFGHRMLPGGAPFNVAVHLAGLGLAPCLVSRIGEDAAGALILALARRMGLDLTGMQTDPERPTGRVAVLESPTGHAFRIEPDQAYDHIEATAAVQTTLAQAQDRPVWLYFGTLALRSAAVRASLAALRAGLKHHVYVDLNWREAGTTPEQALDALHQISVLKLSEDELARVLDWLGLPTAQARFLPLVGESRVAVHTLMQRIGASWLLVTHGEQGAAAWQADGTCAAYAPARHVSNLSDTVGAGDAFSAMALASLMQGHTIQALLERAVAFATTICTIRGALPEQTDFYRAWSSAFKRLPQHL